MAKIPGCVLRTIDNNVDPLRPSPAMNRSVRSEPLEITRSFYSSARAGCLKGEMPLEVAGGIE
jgi:hypothetical protein